MAQTLYRLYDLSGTLLYVGISKKLEQRWHEHASTQTWWHEVASAVLEHYPDRTAVMEAERHAVSTEHPRYNKMLKEKRPVARKHWFLEKTHGEILLERCEQRLSHRPGHQWLESADAADILMMDVAEFRRDKMQIPEDDDVTVVRGSYVLSIAHNIRTAERQRDRWRKDKNGDYRDVIEVASR